MINDRDLSEYTQFDKKINDLTLEQVNAAMKKYFDRSKLVTVFAGDFEKGKTEAPAEKKGF